MIWVAAALVFWGLAWAANVAIGRSSFGATRAGQLIVPALRHRLILSFEAEAEGVLREELIRDAWEASARA